MFCSNCGKEIAEGNQFCGNCGAPMPENLNTLAASSSVGQEDKKKKTGLPKGLLFSCIAILAFFVIIVVVKRKTPTIDLEKYVTFSAGGYNGYGTVSAVIDWDAIKEKYGKKISYTDEAKSEFGVWLNELPPLDAVEECIQIQIDNNGRLSNGDKISYLWEIDQSYMKYVDCKLKYKDGTYKVDDLTEVGKMDIFADVTMTFFGISPAGDFDFNYSGSELTKYDFSFSKTSNLKNGDIVTVSIDNQNPDYYVEKFGAVPVEFEHEYIVNGLSIYVASKAELTDDFLDKMQQEAEDSIWAYTANAYANSSSLNDVKYIGYVFGSVKDNAVHDSIFNYLYMICSGVVSSSQNNFRTSKVYFPVLFCNIAKSVDGNLTYEDKDIIDGKSYLDGSSYYTKGYINPYTCYMQTVDANRNSYNVECGDGFDIYAEFKEINQLKDIDEFYIETLKSETTDIILGYVAQNYNWGFSISELAFEGTYLLLAKSQGTDFGVNNKLVLVYSAAVANERDGWTGTTIYFPVEYDGVVKLPKEEYMVTVAKGMQGESVLSSKTASHFITKGYINGEKMYTDIITANRKDYTYEVSEGLMSFGN